LTSVVGLGGDQVLRELLDLTRHFTSARRPDLVAVLLDQVVESRQEAEQPLVLLEEDVERVVARQRFELLAQLLSAMGREHRHRHRRTPGGRERVTRGRGPDRGKLGAAGALPGRATARAASPSVRGRALPVTRERPRIEKTSGASVRRAAPLSTVD